MTAIDPKLGLAPEHTVQSRHETPLTSSISGTMVMAYELCQPLPEGTPFITFQLLQTRNDGSPYVCNFTQVYFGTAAAAADAFSRVVAGTDKDWSEMGAIEVVERARNPPLDKFQVR